MVSEAADRFCVPVRACATWLRLTRQFERGIKAVLGHVYAAANLQLASAGAILYSHSKAIAIVCASSASDFATTSQLHTWSVFVSAETAWHTFRSASATVRYLVERATHESDPHYRYRILCAAHSLLQR